VLSSTFSGYRALLAAQKSDPMFGRALPIVEQGRRLFATYCASCYAADGSPKPGPDIRRVQNRAVASLDGYNYSPALKAAGGIWDYNRLSEFVADPQKKVPGTRMRSSGIHIYDTHAVIAYLATLDIDMNGLAGPPIPPPSHSQ
jgi:cytochrome c